MTHTATSAHRLICRPDAAAQFAAQRHLLVPKLVSPEEVLALRQSTASLPAQRVVCGGTNSYWEQQIGAGSALHHFFRSPPVISLLTDCVGAAPDISAIQCWTSIYRPGQWINRHRDSRGDLQLVLCLKAASPDNGGWLTLENNGETRELFLQEGDLLCFSATEIDHWTTPMVPSHEQSEPCRITAIARYFFSSVAK